LSTGNKLIEVVSRSDSIDSIADSHHSTDGVDFTDEPGVAMKGNHTMSLQLSLMLNAIKNSRYRALKHFVTLPDFCEALREKFNFGSFRGITLLDYAEGDETAMKILSVTKQYQQRIAAYEEDCLSEQTDPDDS